MRYNTTCCKQIVPVPWLARTGPWESRSLRDVHQSRSSSARVNTCDNFLRSAFSTTTRYCSSSCTCLERWTTPTSAMSTSAGMNAAGYNLLLTVSLIIYIFAYYARSHFVMNFVYVKFLLLFFWIKLLVKIANIRTTPRVVQGDRDDACRDE
jgi:hypothetical protein